MPPKITAVYAYRKATDSIRDKQTRAEYQACTGEIEQKCEAYDLLGKTTKFETALQSSFIVSSLVAPKMQELYDKQFSKLKGTQELRNIIKSGAENNSCPYCGIGYISQLDHYLPKSEFHAVTVHPLNLVPACADCNKVKSTYTPSSGSPAVFHPYFDTAFDTSWLEGTLTQGHDGHAVAIFSVNPKVEDAHLRSRMMKHLEVFDLKNRFSSAASQLIQEFEAIYRNSTQMFALTDIKYFLEMSMRTSASIMHNSYRAATYEAMLRSPWYLNSFKQPN